MKTIQLSDTVYEKLLDEVWVAATDTDYLPEWWDTVDITASGVRLSVRVDDPMHDTRLVRKVLTKHQLLIAYLSMADPTHCGGYHILHDPDSCGADLILQQAAFGEIVFG
jgi:hypothetical protein